MATRHLRPEVQPQRRPVRVIVLFLLFVLVFDASASQSLSVSPTSPTSQDKVTVMVTGVWPQGGSPSITRWLRSDFSIRIDAFGVLPGIPQPLVPYELSVDIGRLPPGKYLVEYYLEVLAAPEPPSPLGSETPTRSPDAILEFEVLVATQGVPALSTGAISLLSVLLLLLAMLAPAKQALRSKNA